jgi:hypothetical protein
MGSSSTKVFNMMAWQCYIGLAVNNETQSMEEADSQSQTLNKEKRWWLTKNGANRLRVVQLVYSFYCYHNKKCS